jgi:hypothetical protein
MNVEEKKRNGVVGEKAWLDYPGVKVCDLRIGCGIKRWTHGAGVPAPGRKNAIKSKSVKVGSPSTVDEHSASTGIHGIRSFEWVVRGNIVVCHGELLGNFLPTPLLPMGRDDIRRHRDVGSLSKQPTFLPLLRLDGDNTSTSTSATTSTASTASLPSTPTSASTSLVPFTLITFSGYVAVPATSARSRGLEFTVILFQPTEILGAKRMSCRRRGGLQLRASM